MDNVGFFSLLHDIYPSTKNKEIKNFLINNLNKKIKKKQAIKSLALILSYIFNCNITY